MLLREAMGYVPIVSCSSISRYLIQHVEADGAEAHRHSIWLKDPAQARSLLLPDSFDCRYASTHMVSTRAEI